jgi:putative hydrolase of the HAD superfamily
MNNVLSSLEGIIFDLDDTLYDKADWIVPAMEFAASHMGFDTHKVWEAATGYIQSRGRADASIYNHVLMACGQSDSALNIRAFIAWMNQYMPGRATLNLYPGVFEALHKLGLYYKMVLLVEGQPDAQRMKVGALGLDNIFQHIIYSDEIEGIKSRLPDPRGLKFCLERLRSRYGHSMLVADNPLKDFVRANQMGLITVRVLTGEYSKYSYPSIEHEAHYAISSAAQLPGLLLANTSYSGQAGEIAKGIEGSTKASA